MSEPDPASEVDRAETGGPEPSQGASIAVELLYATLEEQDLLTLRVPVGTTIEEAIERADFRRKYPDAVIEYGNVGIFSRKEPLDYELRAGDRIEVYRPLQCDPKQVRRERARKQKATGKKAAG